MTPSLGYDGYLFDLDGVLVDTRDWIRDAYLHTAATHGFAASDELLADLYGRPLLECYLRLHPAFPAPETLLACHREYQRNHMELQRIFPGAVETLQAIRERGGRTALISSRAGPSIDLTLDRFNLRSLLDSVIRPEDCSRHKPDPEPVRRALAEIDCAPERALVVGDTPNDIRSGEAAGTDTAGATYGFVGEAVAAARPTHLIAELRDVLALRREGKDG